MENTDKKKIIELQHISSNEINQRYTYVACASPTIFETYKSTFNYDII